MPTGVDGNNGKGREGVADVLGSVMEVGKWGVGVMLTKGRISLPTIS
jgi:hypothetical protein